MASVMQLNHIPCYTHRKFVDVVASNLTSIGRVTKKISRRPAQTKGTDRPSIDFRSCDGSTSTPFDERSRYCRKPRRESNSCKTGTDGDRGTGQRRSVDVACACVVQVTGHAAGEALSLPTTREGA